MTQAFVKGKAIGLQFHLESSRDSIDHLLENCADELTEGQYVQRPEELSAHAESISILKLQLSKYSGSVLSLA